MLQSAYSILIAEIARPRNVFSMLFFGCLKTCLTCLCLKSQPAKFFGERPAIVTSLDNSSLLLKILIPQFIKNTRKENLLFVLMIESIVCTRKTLNKLLAAIQRCSILK